MQCTSYADAVLQVEAGTSGNMSSAKYRCSTMRPGIGDNRGERCWARGHALTNMNTLALTLICGRGLVSARYVDTLLWCRNLWNLHNLIKAHQTIGSRLPRRPLTMPSMSDVTQPP